MKITSIQSGLPLVFTTSHHFSPLSTTWHHCKPLWHQFQPFFLFLQKKEDEEAF